MTQLILSVSTPLLSLIIFTLGSGLLTTLLTIRLQIEGGGAWIVGVITTSYYIGLVLGSFYIGSFIRRVGHIRVYATFASILAVATLLQGLLISNWIWIILRFICGCCTAGLYIAIESWLLIVAPQKLRGQVLSLYMISFYAALAGGQFLLNVSNPESIIPFSIVAMLSSLSIVPLSMTRAACPNLESISPLNFRQLYKVSPSGVIGCFSGGLITAAIYGLMPLFVKQFNQPTSYVALVMGIIIVGAMFLQYPVGHISNNFDRSRVLIIISVTSLVISFALMLTAYYTHVIFLILVFIFGGVSFALYPLSISHICDYLKATDIVAATQGLLLVNGVGSIIGPLFAPGFMHMIGPLGLFVYFALISGILGLFFLWSHTRKSRAPVVEQQEFVAVPRMTPVATELDPRAEK
ncbi:MAG: MFS transporter [Coxiella sp. DG_40]|nr:MAG: MFS transporter [Coxiella sp. DG_40]